MPITDLDIVDLIASSYRDDSTWDHVYRGRPEDDLTICVKWFGRTAILIHPGTTDLQGWMRDFEAIASTPLDHPQLGPIHSGFWSGMDEAIADIGAVVAAAERVIIGGHSLGAARGAIYAGVRTATGRTLDGVVLCGEPRVGMSRFATLMAPVRGRSYRNRADPVCEVPFDVPLIEPYGHEWSLRPVDAAPASFDPWGPLADHHIQLYYEGVAKLSPTPII